MASARDVAAYLLQRRLPAFEAVRLQKLLYYMQAWHLALMDSALFNDPITANKYGPVVGNVLRQHIGNRVVRKTDDIGGDADALTDTERQVVDAVYDAYKRLKTFEIADLSHEEQPWKDAYYAHDGNRLITHDAMREYYAAEVVRPQTERTTPQIPRVPDAKVTYLTADEMQQLQDTMDEPDPFGGLLAALQSKRK